MLVTSLRALHWHGGVALPEIGKPNMEALKEGLCNLEAHIDNLKAFGPAVVVSVNHFAGDDEAELKVLFDCAKAKGVRIALSDGFALGGKGAEDLAREVLAACEGDPPPLNYVYPEDADVVTKTKMVAERVYGAAGISLSDAAKKDLKRITDLGFDKLPVCIAKTPFSLTADPKKLGAPKGFTLPVARLILNAGAGFVVVTTGSIMRMPGLPKVPAALQIDVKDGKITALPNINS